MIWLIAELIAIMLLGMTLIGSSADLYPAKVPQVLPYVSIRSSNMQLLISMELNIPSDGWAKRPYIAVWIEDGNGMAVRTLALWYSNPRWLPELKAWYRTNSRYLKNDKSPFPSVTGATRPPGRYTFKWDGKDNNERSLVPGKYVVCIETAREHNMFQAKGTYTIIREKISCGENSEKIDLPGNAEIKTVTLTYTCPHETH